MNYVLLVALAFALGLIGWLIAHGYDRALDTLTGLFGLAVLVGGICWVAIRKKGT